jgi:hypothetical protein
LGISRRQLEDLQDDALDGGRISLLVRSASFLDEVRKRPDRGRRRQLREVESAAAHRAQAAAAVT